MLNYMYAYKYLCKDDVMIAITCIYLNKSNENIKLPVSLNYY